MATLEEVLAALNGATTNAREVLTKIPQIATTNGDVTFTFADGTRILIPGLPKLKSQVDGFIAGARGEYPASSLLLNPYFNLENNGFPKYWDLTMATGIATIPLVLVYLI